MRIPVVGRWWLKRQIKRELVARGIRRAERKVVMDGVQKVLTLDFAALKGWKTVIGLVVGAVDYLADSSLCVSHPAACVALKGLSGWFLAMGIRGK